MRGKDACYGLSSILLPKIVQAELCDNGWGELAGQLRAMLAQGHLRKRGWAPCAVTVLPARVELGSSYDTPTPALATTPVRIIARGLVERASAGVRQTWASIPLCPASPSHLGPIGRPPSLSFFSHEMDTKAATSPRSSEGREHDYNVP